jgi:hypothetical protein
LPAEEVAAVPVALLLWVVVAAAVDYYLVRLLLHRVLMQ